MRPRPKADLMRKFSFAKITHHLDQEIGKILVKGMSGNEARIPHSILVHDLLAIEIRILFPKLTM